MYVCTYLSMYVYTDLCMYVCTDLCMFVCTYLCMYVCTYLSMYVCTYLSMYVCTYLCMLHTLMYSKVNNNTSFFLFLSSLYLKPVTVMNFYTTWASEFPLVFPNRFLISFDLLLIVLFSQSSHSYCGTYFTFCHYSISLFFLPRIYALRCRYVESADDCATALTCKYS